MKKSYHKSANIDKNNSNEKQYEKLLSATPLSAQLAADDTGQKYKVNLGERAAEEIVQLSNLKQSAINGANAPIEPGQPQVRGSELNTSTQLKNSIASQQNSNKVAQGPREQLLVSELQAIRGNQMSTDNAGSQDSQQHSNQYNINVSQQTFGNNAANQSKTNLNLSLVLRSQKSIQALRAEAQQSSGTPVDPRFMNTTKQGAGDGSGTTVYTQKQAHGTSNGQQNSQLNENYGAQSNSESPKSKQGTRIIDRENAKNFFAISGQKSDEDEGDLDQFQSSRALRNRKLLGSDEIEQDIESKGEGTSPSKQLKKNAFNLKEHSKFDMFNRNGRSIQELNELKGGEGEMHIITARSFDEEAQPAFERAANQNSNKLNQANNQNKLANKDDIMHKSILLTPKNVGFINSLPEGREQRHQSMNVSPNKPTPQLNLQSKLQPPGKFFQSAIGSDWTAGAAKELVIEYENTEQKEQKAKGERMREIIERQMNAEYQNSVNKIIDGAQFNQRGVGGQKIGPAIRSRRQSRQPTAGQLLKLNDGSTQDVGRGHGFQDEEGVPLRQQHHQSFNLQEKENEIGSFIHSGPETYKHQTNSFIGVNQAQLGENDDLNGFYGNDRLDEGQYQPLNSGSRAKYSGNA